MFPSFLKIGPLTFHTYGLMIAIGVFVGLKVIWVLAARDGYEGKKVEDSLYTLMFFFVIGGLLGGRFLHVVTHLNEYSNNFLGVFKIWEGGLVSFGGLFGAFLGFLFWHRQNQYIPWKKCVDWLAPTIAFGHAFGRLGCFFAGCCFGVPTEMPWGIIFTHPESLAPIGIPLHATQIYEAVFLIVLGFYLYNRMNRQCKNESRVDGIVFVQYLILYSIGRFILDFFRGDELRTFGMTPGQFVGILIVAGAIIYKNYYLKPRVDS